ncbi:hypothetical protein [Gracilibacillus sp. YIM 98692]|uniref:hypothetical protein n=1 Tax=Gracilibacillus sp. YIM 98692 TaxID=2663532 RepID=UPI0013D6E390|nr:hypothetical protein [Gracilibacillus sp. YIM 98692]
MKFYEKLPNDLLVDFYTEINKKIKKGENTKSMYYELGLVISVMNRRGIRLVKPSSCSQKVVVKRKSVSA